ncbi:helix-turn-helix domain-containing protein [Sphaerisporangium rhizosphaerae]|uniref:Multiprotein-bridging factor 1 family protein n=1 Tax=Sphaerisporangium rhizosphaerae TaxID=2269375 RepID=A0ABW2P4W1_9ACTN
MPAPRKSSDRYRSMAHYFGALIRDLRDSYESRVGEPLTMSHLAARTGYSASMIGQIERGETLPESGTRVRTLDNALRAEGQLILLWPVVQRLGNHPINDLAAATNRITRGYRENGPCALIGGDDMERRYLLQLAGLGMLAQSPIFSTGEHIRQLLERSFGGPDGGTEDQWEAICADHMHALVNRPPTEALDGLMVDLALLYQQMSVAPPEQSARLQRIAAWMATMHANLLTRLGVYGEAGRWWRTARQAADASQDVDMQVWVRGTEAVFGLYSPRSLETVLTLARDAQTLAAGRVAAGLFQAVSAEAQTLAVMGRHQEARESVQRLHDLVERSTPDRRFNWTSDQVFFVSSWVHSFEGATEAAREARDSTLAQSPCYQNATNVRLHEAISLSSSGGHNEALQLVTKVLSELDPAYRSRMITHTARRVLDAVPSDQRAALPALPDYRAALSAPTST